MGSKKELGRQRRQWSEKIARPLEAINTIELVWQSSKKYFNDPKRTTSDQRSEQRRRCLHAIENWKKSHQTIYLVDNDLINAILETDLPEDVPIDVFERLPHESPAFVLTEPIRTDYDGVLFDEGVFIVTRPFKDSGLGILWIGNGVDHAEIVTHTQSIYSQDGKTVSLKDLLLNHRDKVSSGRGDTLRDLQVKEDYMSVIDKLYSVAAMAILYACSNEPDMEMMEPPELVKRGAKSLGKTEVQFWDIGLRIGNALRGASFAHRGSDGDSDRRVAPHIRKAHWHRFWTGPKDGDRKLVVKWLPPITVNIDKGKIMPTVRPMKKAS
jgi:hypothetical protein